MSKPRPPINGWSHPKGDAWGKPIGGGSVNKGGGCAVTLLGLLAATSLLDLLLAGSTPI